MAVVGQKRSMCEDMGGQPNSSKSVWAFAQSQRMHKSRLSGDGQIEAIIEGIIGTDINLLSYCVVLSQISTKIILKIIR